MSTFKNFNKNPTNENLDELSAIQDEELRSETDNQSSKALYDLGIGHQLAINGCTRDIKKAFEYYLKAAQLGNPAAQYAVGDFFARGIAVEKSYDKAYEYYKKSADQGYSFALGILGIWHEFGINNSLSLDKAKEYYKHCANSVFDKPQMLKNLNASLAVYEIPMKTSFLESFIYYRAKAEQGDSNAQFQVADFIRQGVALYNTPEELVGYAKKFYFLAAEQGHPKAQCWLGYIYERDGNDKEAFQKYTLAASQGDIPALGLLALCYEEGKGTIQSSTDAYRYYEEYSNSNIDLDSFKETTFHWGHVEFFIYNRYQVSRGNKDAQLRVSENYKYGDGTIASNEKSAYFKMVANKSFL